jgi:hypothetical protein
LKSDEVALAVWAFMDEQSFLLQSTAFPQHWRRDGFIEMGEDGSGRAEVGVAFSCEGDAFGRQVVHGLSVHTELPRAAQNACPKALSAHALQLEGSPEQPDWDTGPAGGAGFAFERGGNGTGGW